MAGRGTRFLPATKVVPKELLPIVDKPVIQYLVEEAVESGIEEIIFVISPGKEMIKEHFSHHPELEEALRTKGKQALLEAVEPIHQLAGFQYVYQDEPLGDGHAVLMAEAAVDNEPFLVLFGDDIVKGSVPAARQLIEAFEGESLLATQRIPKEHTLRYGVVDPGAQVGKRIQVNRLVEKPKPEDAPSDLGVIGKYVCSPEIFSSLKQAQSGHQDGEIRLVDGFNHLKGSQEVWAVEIEGDRFDTGYPAGLAAAIQAYLSE